VTPAMHALDYFALLELSLWHATYAIRREVCVARLYTSKTAEILVAGLLPFGYQVLVGYALVDAVVVELPANRLALVEELVNVA